MAVIKQGSENQNPQQILVSVLGLTTDLPRAFGQITTTLCLRLRIYASVGLIPYSLVPVSQGAL